MGGSASTRNISVENDDNTNNVIRISESVYNRIREELQNPDRGGSEARDSAASSSPSTDSSSHQQHPQHQQQAHAEGQDGEGIPQDAVMTVMRLRRERDEAVSAVESTWRRRLNNMEQQAAEHAARQERALRQSADQARRLFTPAAVTPVCHDCQERVVKCCRREISGSAREERVIRCYSDQKGRSLNCASEVQQFSDCVRRNRLDQLIK